MKPPKFPAGTPCIACGDPATKHIPGKRGDCYACKSCAQQYGAVGLEKFVLNAIAGNWKKVWI